MRHLDPCLERIQLVRSRDKLADLLNPINAHAGSDVDQHQRPQQVRVLCGKRHRVHAAHRVPQHHRTVQILVLDELADVLGHVVARVVGELGRSVRVAVAPLIERIPVQPVRQRRRDLVERMAIQREAVQGHGADLGVAAVVDVVKLKPVDRRSLSA